MESHRGTSGRNTVAITTSCAILVLLSLWWTSESLLTIEEEVSATDLKYLLPIAGGTVALQCLIIGLATLATRRISVTAATTAAFIVANAVSLNLIMSPGFVALGPTMMAVALLAGAFVAFTLVKMALESSVLRTLIILALVALIATPAVSALIKEDGAGKAMSGNPSKVVRNVKFVQKPNVYFIGFESMAPQAVLSKYLGYDNSPLLAGFGRHGFRTFKNLFTEQAPTRNSLAQLLLLDADSFAEARSKRRLAFSGNYPSTLLEISKDNGYETNTLYHSAFFGAKAGPWVDRYRINKAFSICTFMDPMESAYAFFGACRLYKRTAWRSSGKVPGPPIEFLLNQMAEVASARKPQFLLAHVAPPKHTNGEFTGSEAEIKEFREAYEKASEQAAANLDRIVDFLKKNDPNSLLFIFGDHGVYLSRGSRDTTFVVQDTHAVAGGVYPSTACADSFDKPINANFVTTTQVARMIIRCLAGGTDPFDSSYKHELFFRDKKLDLGDFVYE